MDKDGMRHHLKRIRQYLAKLEEHILLLEYRLDFEDEPYVMF